MYSCDNCGAQVASATKVADMMLCEGCCRSITTLCDGCGRRVFAKDVYRVPLEICEDCLQEKFLTCDQCRQAVRKEKATVVSDSFLCRTYCSRCYRELFSECAICHADLGSDFHIVSLGRDRILCVSCYNKLEGYFQNHEAR